MVLVNARNAACRNVLATWQVAPHLLGAFRAGWSAGAGKPAPGDIAGVPVTHHCVSAVRLVSVG
eukprot:10868426-Alexandrium_andersonii.AAC.1